MLVRPQTEVLRSALGLSLQERHQGTGECSEKGKEVCEGSKHKSYEELMELGLLSLKKKERKSSI